MKKLTAILLTAAMLFSLSACSDNNAENTTAATTTTSAADNTQQTDKTTTSSDVTTTQATTSAETTTTPTDDTQGAATTKPTEAVTTAKPVTTAEKTTTAAITTTTAATTVKPTPQGGRTAAEIASEMGVGWNLGNSLDATGSGISAETSWGNPKITKELILAVKEMGFNTIRLPITWKGHFDANYNIDSAWLDRVEEIINYILDSGMYCIINIHHDGGDGGWLTPIPTDEDGMVDQFEKVWTQIAKRFKDYNDHLLFAGMNEFHNGYGSATSEYLRITNRLNQSFVTTVRATGGNNKNRILIVQAYNTNGQEAIKGLTIPTDTTANKIMAEFHFYDPWDFAGTGKGTWGIGGTANDSWGQEDWVDKLFSKMKTAFVDKGVPLILGEYGAVINKSGYTDVRRYYTEYVTKAAVDNGIIPIWWDNGNDGNSGEAFALLSRTTYKILHQDLVDAIMRASRGTDYTIKRATY